MIRILSRLRIRKPHSMPTVTDNDLDATNDTCESVQHKRIICEYNTTRGINSIANIVLMEDNGSYDKKLIYVEFERSQI